MSEETAIGLAIAALCLLGLWHSRWFRDETRKGKRLARWFGATGALWVLRVLFGAGAALGVLLALGILRPVRW